MKVERIFVQVNTGKGKENDGGKRITASTNTTIKLHKQTNKQAQTKTNHSGEVSDHVYFSQPVCVTLFFLMKGQIVLLLPLLERSALLSERELVRLVSDTVLFIAWP